MALGSIKVTDAPQQDSSAAQQTLYLNQLTGWEGNVRKTHGKDGITALAANIAAHGLLQSLVVKQRPDGLYDVIAGNRRLMALQQLAAEGRLDQEFEIPVRVLGDGEDEKEVSLAENAIREQMHPADEFEAFRDLVDAGAGIEDIAARFGVTPAVVKQRLKLGRVSPVILAAYRDGETSLTAVMAFTLTDDQAQQERLWHDLPKYHRDSAHFIKRALTESEISSDDRRVKFVTIEAYEAAGGTLRRDLFSDSAYIQDAALLETLTAQKLEDTAAALRADGWSWVEARESFSWEDRSKYRQLKGEQPPLTAEQETQLAAWQKEYDALEEKDADDWTDEDQERFDKLEDLIDEIEDRDKVYSDEVKAQSGCVVTLGYDGTADIAYGLAEKKTAAGNAKTAAKDPDALSAALVESLTAERTAALCVEVIDDKDLALRVAVHAMGLRVIYESPYSALTRAHISVAQNHAAEHSAAHKQLEEFHKDILATVPKKESDFWQWCMTAQHYELMAALAYCTGRSIDCRASDWNKELTDPARPENKLAAAAGLDMTGYFTPTAENYFSRIGKPLMLQAIEEATGEKPDPDVEKLKKADLAAAAERAVSGTGWLPALLRTDKENSND